MRLCRQLISVLNSLKFDYVICLYLNIGIHPIVVYISDYPRPVMSYLSKTIKLMLMALSILCLCSCDYRALAKENKELEKRKAKLSGDFRSLENNMEENPDDSIALLEQSKTKLKHLKKKRDKLQSSVTKLSEEHDMLKKKNSKNERDFIIK